MAAQPAWFFRRPNSIEKDRVRCRQAGTRFGISPDHALYPSPAGGIPRAAKLYRPSARGTLVVPRQRLQSRTQSTQTTTQRLLSAKNFA